MTRGVPVTAAVLADHSDALQVTSAGTQAVGHSDRHLADARSNAWVDCAMSVRFHDASRVTCRTNDTTPQAHQFGLVVSAFL